MLNPENIAINKKIEECNLICIFLDVRNSTAINRRFKKEKLFEIYSYILNSSYEKLTLNGFKNVEIQGDGIYGVMECNNKFDKTNQIIKTILEIKDIIDFSFNMYKVKSTISIGYGKEYYGSFGQRENNKKRLSFFGNVVSKTKKMNSLALNGKIVIAKNNFDNRIIDLIFKKINLESKDIYLKNGRKIGPVILYKW